jgi:hypothetical protein
MTGVSIRTCVVNFASLLAQTLAPALMNELGIGRAIQNATQGHRLAGNRSKGSHS